MPFALIMALLTFFVSKKSGASDSKAMLAAGLAGAGSYYVATQTDWGQENLNWFESDADKTKATTVPLVDAKGNPVTDASGNVLTKVVSSTADVLKSWGGTGTAAVIGTTAVASSSNLQKYIPWILAGVAALVILK